MNQSINFNHLHLKHLCCKKIYLQAINWHLFLTLTLNNKHVQKWQSVKLWFLLENYKYKLISIDLLFKATRLSTWERVEQIALNWSVMRKHQRPSKRTSRSLQRSRYAKTGLGGQLHIIRTKNARLEPSCSTWKHIKCPVGVIPATTSERAVFNNYNYFCAN